MEGRMENRTLMMSERRVIMDMEGHMSTETMTTHNSAEQRVIVDTQTGAISPLTVTAPVKTQDEDQPIKMVSDTTIFLTESGQMIQAEGQGNGSESAAEQSDLTTTQKNPDPLPIVPEASQSLPDIAQQSKLGQSADVDGVSGVESVSSSASTNQLRMPPVTDVAVDTSTWRAGDEINWRKRCQTLETSLLKFKQRTADIRDRLAHKMDELNKKADVAERRAERAEEKNQELEARLHARSWPRGEFSLKISRLEEEVKEKDKKVVTLQQQLDELQSFRHQEAKLVEEKSNKIKDWVSKKLREMERDNAQYRMENETLRDQVEILRARLHALPISTMREIHRISMQDSDSLHSSSLIPTPPEIPQRPSSTVLESFRQERRLVEHLGSEVAKRLQEDVSASQMISDISPDLDDHTVDHEDDDNEPLYQEIDDNHESKYEPKRRVGQRKVIPSHKMAPPQVRIERKIFPNPQLPSSMTSSMVSSTNGSEEMLDRADGYATVKDRADAYISSHEHRDIYATVQHAAPPMLTPLRSKVPVPVRSSSPKSDVPNRTEAAMAQFIPLPSSSPPPICPFSTSYGSNIVSALATVPRRKKDSRLHAEGLKPVSHDRRLPGTKDDTSTIPYEHLQADQGQGRRLKPPTPPMRRLPSWESRIYTIANIGLRLPDPGTDNRESSYPVTEGLYTDTMYQDLSVPVYTTLKGKAAQIRSTPFTGDSSSDSSDNEDISAMMPSSPCLPSGDTEAVVTVAGPNCSKTTTSVSVRKQVNHTSSGATKRGVSSHSLGSETSSDYAVPPDEVSILTDSSDNSEPEQKLLKCTTEHFKKDSLEKHGYLTKLGGKVKNWKRRWFVLRNGEMLYYKGPNDVVRKPQGFISLDGQSRISKTEGYNTFEIATSKRTYYLTTDGKEEMDQWIRVLQNVLKKLAADRVLCQPRAKEVMKGWLIKTRHGRSRRCWCILMGKFFLYYKAPGDKTPLGQIHLRDARIEEVDRSCDSETDSDDTAIPDYTLGILPTHAAPTYLMIPTKQEKDSWLYHLTVAAGGGSGNVGTEYEQLISKLMEVDGDANSIYWKHPSLLHTKEPIAKSLTTLPSEELQQKSISLFKSCHLFMQLALDSPQIDYHVSLAQNILDMCLQHPELQDELYCQLMMQTSRHPPQHKSGVQNLLLCGGSHSWFLCDATPTSPTNSVMDLTSDSKFNPISYVFIQGWQLLAMCVSLFLPKQSVLWYLKAHLQRNSDPRNDVGKYAIFCQRALERTMANGGREARPSRMEILSILLRNPYHHSQPISIPVHFLQGTYQVVSFDGSTTVQEFIQSLNKAITMRDCALSGFALFTDDPAGQELEHCLKGHLKLCDVISKWEQAFMHHNSKRGRPDTNRTVKLVYKNRLYFKTLTRTETEKERLLLAFQVNLDVVNGRFPLNKDLAVELAALMAQIEFGDYRSPTERDSITCPVGGRITPPDSQQQLPVIVERFYPHRYRTSCPMDLRVLERRVQDKWVALKGRTVTDCIRIYLTVARKWPFFGAKLFSAKFKYGDVTQVWLAVQEESISVLEYATLKAVSTYEYRHVVTFGGCREDFMLVVSPQEGVSSTLHSSRTDRLLFAMTKPKILEVTMLMASYINSRVQHKNSPPTNDSRPRLSSAGSINSKMTVSMEI